MKPSERGERLVVRVYNPTATGTQARIAVRAAARVWRASLAEELLEGLEITQGAVAVEVGPKAIVTLLVEP